MVHLYLLGEKALVSLRSLPNHFFSAVSMVIIGTDNNTLNDFSFEIKDFCQKNDLRYLVQNKTYNSENNVYSITIGWRWLINDKSKIIVFHDSLLPKLRGFNPLVTSLINGHKEIGVTVIEGNEEFDKGDIILQKKIRINYPIKINQAISLVSKLYANLFEEVFSLIILGNFKKHKQDESKATYGLWRDEKDYRIDWSKSAEEIKRFIDAVGFPYKGATTKYEEALLIIKDAETDHDVVIENRCVGKVIFKKEETFFIVCGKGIIKVKDFFDTNGDLVKINNYRIRFK